MKIAIIGNMNNNGFALMRYLCDLGQDAHLYLYSNDGKGSLDHFRPESDTWNISRWQRRIHELSFSNSLIPVSGRIVQFLRKAWLFVAGQKSRKECVFHDHVDKEYIRQTFLSFDRIICSGIAPAILSRAGVKVDIYYPYSTGVEFLGNLDVVMGSLFKRLYVGLSRREVLQGLRSVRYIFNSELSLTAQVLRKHNLNFVPIAIPMVYYRDADFPLDLPTWLRRVIDVIKGSDFVVVAPARNQWVRPVNVSEENWFESKHTDWLIKSFSEFLKRRPKCKAILCLFEYGPDVGPSKDLIAELAISEQVLWIQKCNRKEILLIDAHASVCVGEFRDQEKIIWGGTGWEALATGKPLLQSFNFNDDEFEAEFGMPVPPLLRVCNEESVLVQLLFAYDNPQRSVEIGLAAREWFNTFNGINLTRRWLDFIAAPHVIANQTLKSTADG